MLNFVFYAPTKIFFGPGKIEVLGEQIKQYADRVLLVYGKGSVKRSGVYDAVVAQLQAHGITWVELGGVDPNPRISTVREGAQLCREQTLGFVLAVGGGSAIDCAKGIAAAALYDGDPWDFWAWETRVRRALPLGTVLTLAATGSEMNDGTVVTNEATQQKHGMSGEPLWPKFSILDPTYTFTVPPLQTAAGVADIMVHIFEFYFSPAPEAFLQDALAEAVLKTCIRYGSIAYREPEHYEARANLMWASSLALNGITNEGKPFDGFNHLVEHGLSGIYDLTHGVGLAILAPHWLAYVLDGTTVGKLAAFARNVWEIAAADDWEAARAGIQALRDFYRGLGLPGQLSEVGIGAERFDDIIREALRRDGTVGLLKKLTAEDVRAILTRAL